MISIKLIAVDKEKTGSDNAVTRNTVTRNDNTETYIPDDIELNTLKIGSAYLCYDKAVNALKVYGANDGSMNLYALGDVAALGQSSMQGGGGSGGISYNRLDSWSSYDASKAGWVLSAGLGKNLDGRVASLENGQIEGVATQEWVKDQGYLTELPTATTNALGAIKIGYSANNKNYPVTLDNNNRAYVNVPWTDTTYSANNGVGLSGTTFYNSGVRSVSTNGNYLRVNTNGTNVDLTIPYATSATKLATARTINGTSFDGSANITTANWGTARNISIADSDSSNIGSAVSVNGSAAVTLKLPATIKATLNGNADTAITASKLSTVSKTAWGQTFWTSGGVPTSISGALSSVTNITMSGYIKIGDAYLTYDSTNNAIRVSKNADGTGATNFYALGGVSALGAGSSGSGGSGTSYNRLDTWSSYDSTKSGWVLSALLGNDLNSRVTSLENGQIEGVATQEWVEKQGFATENWVTKKGYLTSLAHNHTITIGNASKSVGVGGTAKFTLADIGAQAAGNYATSGHTHKVKINGQEKTIAASGGTAVDLGTYLTAHQSLAAYATTEWVTNNFNKYVLPVAGTAIGGVKSGTDITVDANGNVSVNDNSHNHKWANISDAPTSLPASDVYAWAKAPTKPSYTLDEVTDGSTRKLSNYVTAIGTSGNTLTWSKNGVAQPAITVPFATNATNATNAINAQYATNAASATKLATPRTIWGQSFDGSANVSGAMTGVTSMDGLIYFNTTNNYIGISNTSPNYKLDVTGVIHSSAGMFSDEYVSALGQNTSSDERLKDIKGDIDLSVGLYANAPSKLFEWKDNKALGTQVGTIAQYWQRELPQVVHDRGDGYLAMQYDVTALLGVISVAKKVVEQEDMIKKLEETIEKLRNEIDMMKKG